MSTRRESEFWENKSSSIQKGKLCTVRIYIKSTFSITLDSPGYTQGSPWAAFVSDQCSRTLSRDSSQWDWSQKQEFKFPQAASGILVCIWKLRTGGVPSKTRPLFPLLPTQASSSQAFCTSHLGFIFFYFILFTF